MRIKTKLKEKGCNQKVRKGANLTKEEEENREEVAKYVEGDQK